MKYVEFGKENKDVVVFLHGGGLSLWNYKEVSETLQDKYHIIIPILNGHSGSDRPFVSIEENADEIINYINKYHNGSVLLIGGVSLGAQIAVEILTKQSDICKYAVIESALVKPMKLTHSLVKVMMDLSYNLIKKPWFSKLQFKSLKIKNELYDDYYNDTCSITKANMIAFLKANSSYSLKENIRNTKAKVYIFVGKKELSKMIQSAKLLNNIIPNSVLDIKNMYHGEYSLNYVNEYVGMIREITEI